MEGEVLEWKGKYGWVQPYTAIDHPLAYKNGGRLFVSKSDLADGVSRLMPGTSCWFHVFSDGRGLGADEVAG